MRRIYAIFLMIAFCSHVVFAQQNAKQSAKFQTEKPTIQKWSSKTPFEQKVFIENLGQYDLKDKAASSAILFGARQEGMHYYFTNNSIWIKYLAKVERTEEEREAFAKLMGEKEGKADGEREDKIVRYKYVDQFHKMEFIGAGAVTTIIAEEKVYQYYTFQTDKKVNVKANGYKKITYKNLYSGIDMEFYFPEDKQGFKYNLIVHAGADASQIKIKYPLNEKINLTKEGDISIKSIFGDFKDHAPIANVLSTPVACSFGLAKGIVNFTVSNYDKSKELIIDPWTTTPVFAGGNSAFDVDWDNAGNVYAYGSISPFQLIKYNAAGVQQWIYTTNFLGGWYYGDFAVDKNTGSIYLTDGFNSSGAEAKKVSSAGALLVTYPGNPSFQEMWRIVFSRCANGAVIAGGGTSSNPAYTGCYLDTTLVNMNPVDVINSGGNGLHDMWGVALDAFGSAYFCTAKTQVGIPGFDNIIYKVATPALAPIAWQTPTTYNFVEVASVIYAPGPPPNGFNGIIMGNLALYTYDSYVLKSWNTATGAQIGTSNVNGTSQSTMTYGGLAVDECDRLFLGTNNTIKIYDGVSMTQTGTMAAVDTVYDLALGSNNILYSCGMGFVSAAQSNLPPCSQVTHTITNGTCANPIGSATITVTGGTPPYTITWNTSPVQTGSVVTNLSTGTYIATITDNSCVKQTMYDTIVVTSSSGFAATPSITNVKCKGGNTGALSIAITGTVVPTYSWSTGSTATSITGLTAGSYTCVMTGGGCNSSLVLTVTEPTALSYTLTPGTLQCFGDTTSISIAVSGGNPSTAAPTYTVAWSPPNATGFAVHGLGAGGYGGVVTDSNGCVIAFNTTLTQPAQIIPTFTYTPACLGSPIQFNDQSTGGPFTWAWNFGDGAGLATTQNPQHTYLAAGTYTTTLTVTNANGCTSSTPKQVIIDIPPQAAFVGDTLTGCPIHDVDFTDQSTCTAGVINSWVWSFGNGLSYTGQTPSSVSYDNLSPTVSANFTASLTVVSSNGCSSTVVKNNYITVYPHPKPGFNYASDDGNIIDVLNNTVHFYDFSLGANSMSYNLGDVFANPYSVNYTSNPNPVHQYQYPDPYTYYVTQVVSNLWGCKDSTMQPIIIRPTFTFYIPNSFSPNGDGVNEGFKGTGIGIDLTTYSLVIFDRWGNKVFTSNDLEKAWDGKLKGKGDVVLEDVYAWKVHFKDGGGLTHEYHGIVSVIK